MRAVNGMSVIADIAPQAPFRRGDSVVTPPNSSVMFAECAVIPTLTGEIDAGEHWLCCAVNASGDSDARQPILPTLRIQNNTLEVTDNACGKTLSLHI
ncbi:Uncharacterised protein [Kluyvera cryocrescens]|uniref:Uncharacterized protein n=1 Tax=Kluyvera cryocrescens TaxID=580 RepID=A0A485AHL0_KLUCR|nr:Uncharacterised protein [Kluyvera cryocrescens]